MSKYYCNIGLEVHIRLNTKSKLFCRCVNSASKANENICPYCLAHPGALPVLNRAAIGKAALLAFNIEANLSDIIAFDRKNYFYPDLPKGYQITQYFTPLATGGSIETEEGAVEIERLHIEEDAAKMKHYDSYSLVDFNRSGAPLVEIVTKPQIKTPQQAAQVFRYIRLMALYLGITDGVMQDGDLRCDANISVSTDKSLPDYKVEIKNINSFKFLEKALQFEYKRQSELLEKGFNIESETRSINENSGETYLIRSNESKETYRYMKEPDILPFHLPQFELYKTDSPLQKHKKYIGMGLEKNAAEFLRDNPGEAEVFDELQSNLPNIKVNALFNLLSLSIYIGVKNAKYKETYLVVLKLYSDERLSKDSTVKLLSLCTQSDDFDPVVYAEEKNLIYIDDKQYIEKCITKIIENNSETVAEIRAGNKRKLGRLTGIIATSYANINPKYISQYLKNILG